MSVEPSIPGRLLLDSAVLENPNVFYRQLAETAPVWRAGPTDIYVAASYEAVTQACRRVEDFSSNIRFLLYRDGNGLPARLLYVDEHGRRERDGFDGEAVPQILANADPPHHARHKKLISPEFSPKRIASLTPLLVELTRDRLAAGFGSGRMDFMSDLANLIPIDIVSSLIGFRERNTEALFKAAIIQTDMLASAISLDELNSRLAVSNETFLWVFQQLQDAVQSPAPGILGLLASAIHDDEIDMSAAMAILMTLFAAGGESTSSLIGNSVLALAQDIDLQRHMRSDLALIPALLEEILRLESPFRYHMRFVTRDCELCGVSIPQGATLLLMWGAANRDPAQFERPDEIDITRPRQHVGFGSGVHVCLGNTLARLEARIVLETLLAETSQFRLDENSVAQWVPSLAVRRLHALPLMLTPS